METHKDDFIVANGDITESWDVDKVSDIWLGHPLLCEAIREHVNVLIRGNHDSEFDSFLGMEFQESIIVGDTLIFHGHKLDYWNSGSRKLIGRALTPLLKSVQEIIGWSAKRKLRQWFDNKGRYGKTEKYVEASFELLQKMGLKNIIMGHTHNRHWEIDRDFAYYNSGHWIHGTTGDHISIDIGSL